MRLLEQTARTEGGNRPSGFIFEEQMRDTCFNLRDSLLAQKSELSSSRLADPFFLFFFSSFLSLSLGYTLFIFFFLKTLTISHPNTHLLQVLNPDLESPRQGALGRTDKSKLLSDWIFGLLKIKVQTKSSPNYILEVGTPWLQICC